VVDDDTMILKLCSLILKKNNITHTTYNNPNSLLSEIQDESVSHIFIDIRMPQMNGVQLCKALKGRYGTDTKFTALTAHVLPDERDTLIQDGFDAVLTKPFHESELLLALGVHKLQENPVTNTLDFAVVRKMTMGDEALFQSVMQQFLEDSDEDQQKLSEYLKSGDRKQIREIVHKLAGRFGQMGIFALSAKLRDLEISLVDGKSLNDLSEELHAALNETTSLLQGIKLTRIEHLN
jgi:CheY-like chemotaxis protein